MVVLTPLAVIFVAIFIEILEIYNHHSLVEGLGGIADKALFYPKVMFAITIYEKLVEVGTLGAYGYGFLQFGFISCQQYAVYEVKHNRSYLIIKVKNQTFNYHIHILWGFVTCAIADAGRIKLMLPFSFAF